MNKLLNYLTDEKQSKRKGGLYHKTQVNLAYNSNRIEGSRLTEEQTRYIFENIYLAREDQACLESSEREIFGRSQTRTIGFKDEEAVPVDDIIETSNHFVAFDYLLDTVENPLTNDIIKEFHRILKTGTSDAAKPWLRVGDWKKLANEVGSTETTKPEEVENEMNKLNDWYLSGKDAARHVSTFENIIEYHYRFEKIHPFQDGNGRVGRLILFRECLRNGVVPFIIDERHKQFYYRGLKDFATARGYLLDTCLSAQDVYKEWVKYFYGE
jgi:Fic family protein